MPEQPGADGNVKTEVEAWGLTYERYAIAQCLIGLARRHGITEVAEMPAHGEKAMPSLYSLGFGLHGCKVDLINGDPSYEDQWQRLSLGDRVRFIEVPDLCRTGLPDASYDLVWNFAYLPYSLDPGTLLREMARLSRRYVAFFSVNDGNVGFPIHRMVHRWTGIPWTHGDITYNNRRNVVRFLVENGLGVVEKGFVNCPFWPDSLGPRDVRLHRMFEKYGKQKVRWESPHVHMLEHDAVPAWIKLVYLFERMPMITPLKTLYAHIFYVIGRKPDDGGAEPGQ